MPDRGMVGAAYATLRHTDGAAIGTDTARPCELPDEFLGPDFVRVSITSLQIVYSAFKQTSSRAEDCHLLRLLFAVKEDVDFHISTGMQQPDAVESQ